MYKLTDNDAHALVSLINSVTQTAIKKSETVLEIGAALTVEKNSNVIDIKIVYPY